MYLDTDRILHQTHSCLWEAMTAIAVSDFANAKAYEELQIQLGKSACMGFQELGVTPTEEGWIIHVNACNEDGKVEILIPKDARKPVQILADTRATSQSYDTT
jgi:hypothetical protein